MPIPLFESFRNVTPVFAQFQAPCIDKSGGRGYLFSLECDPDEFTLCYRKNGLAALYAKALDGVNKAARFVERNIELLMPSGPERFVQERFGRTWRRLL